MNFLTRICTSVFNWLVNDKRESDINSELKNYFIIAAKLALIVSILIFLFGLSTLIHWPYTINVEALATYAGTLLATIVAFAGSIVAIKLSLQAIKITQEQNRLAEEQNRQAITQRPEYIEGLNAALAYARFKGMLLLLPFNFRSLQKRNTVNSMQLASGADDTKNIEGLTKHLNELLETTFVTVFAQVAIKSSPNGTGFDRKILFLNRFSVLQSSKNLLRGIRLGLIVQREVDEIVKEVYEKSTNSLERKSLKDYTDFESYSKEFGGDEHEKDKLTEIEFWFVKHVYPYVISDQKITYDDFNHLVVNARESLVAFANKIGIYTKEHKSLKNLILFQNTSKECKVFANIENDSLFKLVNKNRTLCKNKTFKTLSINNLTDEVLKEEGVIQLTFTDAWDIQLGKLLLALAMFKFDPSTMRLDDTRERKAKIIVIFDQVGLYKDSYERVKNFTLSDHLLIWKFFKSLNNIILQSELQIKHTLFLDRGAKSTPSLIDQKKTEIRSSTEHLNRMKICISKLVPNAEELFYFDAYLELLECVAKTVLNGDELKTLNEKASNKLKGSTWASNFLVKMKSIYSENPNLDFDQAEMSAIEQLTLTPLFERPIYGLKLPVDGFYQDIPIQVPKDVEFMAHVSLDENEGSGELIWPNNIFVEWLISAPPNDNGVIYKDVYWIDQI